MPLPDHARAALLLGAPIEVVPSPHRAAGHYDVLVAGAVLGALRWNKRYRSTTGYVWRVSETSYGRVPSGMRDWVSVSSAARVAVTYALYPDPQDHRPVIEAAVVFPDGPPP